MHEPWASEVYSQHNRPRGEPRTVADKSYVLVKVVHLTAAAGKERSSFKSSLGQGGAPKEVKLESSELGSL